MGNNQSVQNPRQGHSISAQTSDDKLRKSMKLTKPKMGDAPNPISGYVSLSRMGSRTSIQNISLPNPPSRRNSISGDTVRYPSPPTRPGSVDLGRRSTLAHYPTHKPSAETLNGPTFSASNVGADVWLERRRSQLNGRHNNPTTPMSPVHTNPMTMDDVEIPQTLDLEELPPSTASSTTSSYHSAPQSPVKRFTPSPTNFMNGGNYPTVYISDATEYQVPVRRRSLLQAAAPGTATRPKAPQSNDDSNEITTTLPSQLLALDLAVLRPGTPHDLEALGGFKKGSLFVTNGAPSPAPSSPSLRAVSSTSLCQRDPSLLSIPPLPSSNTSVATGNSKPENFTIPRKPVPSSVPSSPQPVKKPLIQIDTSSVRPRLGLRIVPPSPDSKVSDLEEMAKIQPRSFDMDDESIDEDPHKEHLSSHHGKQSINGINLPSPTSDYSAGVTPTDPSAKAEFVGSSFSYEGATETEEAERHNIMVEPTKGLMELDTSSILEEFKPKPLVIRKNLSVHHLNAPADVRSSQYVSAVSAEGSENGGTDSGYSSPGSIFQPPPKSLKRLKDMQSAAEQSMTNLNQPTADTHVTSDDVVESGITSSVITIPYASVRNGAPPALEGSSPKTDKEASATLGKKAENEGQDEVEVDASAQPKQKKKRRLSFKRLSFKSDKGKLAKKQAESGVSRPARIVFENAAKEEKPPTLSIHSQPNQEAPMQLEQTQHQIQPQPKRRSSFSGNTRIEHQSVLESHSLPNSPAESSPYEPMALTSSTPSRGVQAVRSSESVSYTGAIYYQRFATPSPGQGNIPNAPTQQIPERQLSLSRPPPSSYRPPSKLSTNDAKSSKPDAQKRRQPLGNSSIKSPVYSHHSQPGSTRVSRNNSFSSLYDTQNGVYQLPPPRYSNGHQDGNPRYNSQLPYPPNYNTALPFAPTNPNVRRGRNNSSESVGPNGYLHMGQDFSSDRLLYGLDFVDIPVRRANDLVQNYGSGKGGYTRKDSNEMPFELLHAISNGTFVNDDEGMERHQKKKDSFWKIVGKNRSKSQTREIIGY